MRPSFVGGCMATAMCGCCQHVDAAYARLLPTRGCRISAAASAYVAVVGLLSHAIDLMLQSSHPMILCNRYRQWNRQSIKIVALNNIDNKL
ncbi:hypothetical protein BHM03_00046623 [Ensete ventricosum]|nr:hypothetical protein BHM03_00046623 [Ensete ventricosum]